MLNKKKQSDLSSKIKQDLSKEILANPVLIYPAESFKEMAATSYSGACYFVENNKAYFIVGFVLTVAAAAFIIY